MYPDRLKKKQDPRVIMYGSGFSKKNWIPGFQSTDPDRLKKKNDEVRIRIY